MKKKLLIKESDLEKFVENFLKEGQLEIDFPKDSLTEMLEAKYEEIIEEVAYALQEDDIETLDNIYDTKIFNLTKTLHKIPQNMEIVHKFNELEDALIDYVELKRQQMSLQKEIDDSLDELQSLL